MTDTIAEARDAPAADMPRDPVILRIVRAVGWTFIWIGLLALGFVVHQVYITTWFAQQQQGALNEERLSYFDEVADQIHPVVVDADGIPITDPETGEPIEPIVTIPPDGSQPGNPSTSFPPQSTDLSDYTIIPEPDVPKGKAFAIIRIPKLDRLAEGWNVVEGVELRQLRKGAGHMPWTPYPGQIGNAVISGHRTTYGAPFHELDELEPGDRIEVETVTGVHVYAVRKIEVVKPTALWVTAKDGPARAGLVGGDSGAWLTLTTCNPKHSARQRLIVFAELVDGPNFETIDRLYG